MNKLGELSEITDTALFLTGDTFIHITGEAIRENGRLDL